MQDSFHVELRRVLRELTVFQHCFHRALQGLSGIVSCDAAALRIRIRIVRCQRPRNVKNANIAKHRPIFLPPLLLVGSKELFMKVPKPRAISHCDSCDKKMLRFVCPSCTRDTGGIAAKLLRCGIASEALRRNMPLSSGGTPEGATTLPWLCKCARPFIQSVKSTLSYLKSCHSVQGHRLMFAKC